MKAYLTLVVCTAVLAVTLAAPQLNRQRRETSKKGQTDTQTRDALDDFQAWRDQQTQQQQTQQTRKTRSPSRQQRDPEEFSQQVQQERGRLEDLSQQTQRESGRLEDLTQQTQRESGRLEDLTQQTQQERGRLSDVSSGELTQQTQDFSAQVVEDTIQQTHQSAAQSAFEDGEDHHHVTQAPTLWDKIKGGASQAYAATKNTAKELGSRVIETVEDLG